MTENPPRKHHFIPAFYLAEWAGTDGKLCQMKQVRPGKVAPQRKHPEATGFELDLYRVEGLPPELEQAIEMKFMCPLDSEASNALQKLVKADTQAWNDRERSAWTRFILSLLYRHPERVRALKAHMRDLHLAAHESVGKPLDEQSAREAAMRMLREIIDNENVGPTINAMHWSRISLDQGDRPLLTSDRPLVMPFNLAPPHAFIGLPIGPHLLFVAGYGDRWARHFALKPGAILEQINRNVVAQARSVVWGVDDAELALVEQTIGSMPLPPLISPDQKRATMDAARGLS